MSRAAIAGSAATGRCVGWLLPRVPCVRTPRAAIRCRGCRSGRSSTTCAQPRAGGMLLLLLAWLGSAAASVVWTIVVLAVALIACARHRTDRPAAQAATMRLSSSTCARSPRTAQTQFAQALLALAWLPYEAAYRSMRSCARSGGRWSRTAGCWSGSLRARSSRSKQHDAGSWPRSTARCGSRRRWPIWLAR